MDQALQCHDDHLSVFCELTVCVMQYKCLVVDLLPSKCVHIKWAFETTDPQ